MTSSKPPDKSITIPFREFKKAIAVSTLNNNLNGYAYLKEEHKAKVTDFEWTIGMALHFYKNNVYCRYPHLFKPYKTKIHHQKVKQLGSEDYLIALAHELQTKNLLDMADNSFALAFVALKPNY